MHSVKREKGASLPQISRTAALLLAEAKQEKKIQHIALPNVEVIVLPQNNNVVIVVVVLF